MTRLLCIGDTHLGAWPAYADQRLDEQERVLRQALQIGVEEGCQGVLFAGDATHTPRPAPEHYLAFLRPVWVSARPMLAISGNSHDTRSAELPIPLEVLSQHAGLVRLSRVPDLIDFCGVQVATLPWTPVGRLVAQAGGGDRDDVNGQAAELLLQTARGLRAQVDATRPCVLLLHWSISGAVTPDGADVGLFREPVLDVHELEAMGWQAVVAGHIHKPQILFGGADGNGVWSSPSLGFYTGSPMPLNFGEAGSAHGCWILDLDTQGATAEFVPIESRRFHTIDEHLSAHDQPGLELACTGAEVDDAIVKVRLTGTASELRAFNLARLSRAILDAGAHRAYIQHVPVREDRARVDGMDEQVDDAKALDLWIETQGYEDDFVAALRDRHARYAEQVNA